MLQNNIFNDLNDTITRFDISSDYMGPGGGAGEGCWRVLAGFAPAQRPDAFVWHLVPCLFIFCSRDESAAQPT